MKTYHIELACDTQELESFAEWLREQGHTVQFNSSTGNYIDGFWTGDDSELSEIFNRLWDGYCNS